MARLNLCVCAQAVNYDHLSCLTMFSHKKTANRTQDVSLGWYLHMSSEVNGRCVQGKSWLTVLYTTECCVWTYCGDTRNKMTGIWELVEAAMLPTHASHNMPGTVGVSWMALLPIWPITQAERGCFQRDPAATWSGTVSTGVSGRLGRRGQSPAGLWETDISTLEL